MRRLADAREQVDTWRGLESRSNELQQLLQLARDESDEELSRAVASDVASLAAEFEEMELGLALSGEYDRRDAILAIHAGAGGTDSQDWAEMLLRMYLRWADKRGYKTDVLDMTAGEEAGIKSATIEVRGRNAYGYLRGERGVHRLVRISPYDASKSRHTSFALAEVMPEVESEAEVRLDPDELRIDTFRASGHGGQNVQKNATAVRITHIPTGIVVMMQDSRSQHKNRASAMNILRSRIYDAERQRVDAARSADRKEKVGSGDRSERIRTYNFPQGRVTDHRINLTLYKLPQVISGEALGELIDALTTEHQAAQLAAQGAAA